MVDMTIAEFGANQELLANPDWLYDIDGLSRGRIDIRVSQNGDWFHDGDKIVRVGLIRLLESSLLCLEGRFYLRAPEQLLLIQVDDCPFLITDFELRDASNFDAQSLIIKTTTGITRLVGRDYPLSSLPFAQKTLAEKTWSKRATDQSNPSEETAFEPAGKPVLQQDNLSSSETTEAQEASPPVVLIRDGMYARFNRNSYYRLVDAALRLREGATAADEEQLAIRSSGQNFVIS